MIERESKNRSMGTEREQLGAEDTQCELACDHVEMCSTYTMLLLRVS